MAGLDITKRVDMFDPADRAVDAASRRAGRVDAHPARGDRHDDVSARRAAGPGRTSRAARRTRSTRRIPSRSGARSPRCRRARSAASAAVVVAPPRIYLFGGATHDERARDEPRLRHRRPTRGSRHAGSAGAALAPGRHAARRRDVRSSTGGLATLDSNTQRRRHVGAAARAATDVGDEDADAEPARRLRVRRRRRAS